MSKNKSDESWNTQKQLPIRIWPVWTKTKIYFFADFFFFFFYSLSLYSVITHTIYFVLFLVVCEKFCVHQTYWFFDCDPASAYATGVFFSFLLLSLLLVLLLFVVVVCIRIFYIIFSLLLSVSYDDTSIYCLVYRGQLSKQWIDNITDTTL